MSEEFRMVWAEPLTAFCQRVFEKMGVPSQDARTTSEVLVMADLRGVDSHGVARLRRNYTGLKNGVMVPRPGMKVVHESPLTALLDEGEALGQVAGLKGMTMAIEKEFELEEKYRKEGIPLYFKVYEDLKAIAGEVGVHFNL